MQANNLSTKAIMNQGIYEMRMKMYEKAVENFSMVIREETIIKEFKCQIKVQYLNGFS